MSWSIPVMRLHFQNTHIFTMPRVHQNPWNSKSLYYNNCNFNKSLEGLKSLIFCWIY